MKTLLIGSLLLLLAGCSSAQLAKEQAIFLKLKADTTTVLVVGCANLPTIEVALTTVLEFMPPSTNKTTIESGLMITDSVAKALCAKVATMTPPTVGAP